MLATDRLLEIETLYSADVRQIVPLELEGEAVRLIIYLPDGTNLRVTEQWNGEQLERYSYYWLTAASELKIGWNNAPHHTRLANFPHHKHIGRPENRQPSFETRLEDVMRAIFTEVSAQR